MGFLTKLFGTNMAKEIKRLDPIVRKIEALEEEYKGYTDAQLQAKTPELKERYKNGETLDDLLPEAFATCREAADRVLGLRPYRVQLIGGIILHQGRIAEMKTGEGKTLVATLPAYLNALSGEGVHIVTVNDYLAKRDSDWMGKVYRFLGLSVGLVIHGVDPAGKRAAYNADITYGTNNEFGFDYLRDNMAIYKAELMQRGHAFAIVDEVDSILIDEARTPLIISGMGEQSTQLYTLADRFAAGLTGLVKATVDDKEEEDEDIDADYVVNEKARAVTLTARGIAKAEKAFNVENLSDPENTTLSHHINQAIRARGLMKRDIDYVVKDGEVIIVDEFTGRLMYGRRYNDGLHQAIEAKEGVTVARESKTLATITFQNYFRLYKKLSGMTGTALTEEEEFSSTYQLDIVEVPTNKPMIRVDHPDEVYKNTTGKYHAIVRQIVACHEKGQPVLAGTTSIEKSEILSRLLDKEGIKHNVLNAKNHEKEAEIIAQAGKFGAVTVATNMAGRGTDIMLGGNAEFLAKNDLKKAGFTPDLIAEATGFAETDNETILKARKMFSDAEDKYRKELAPEADKVREAGGLFILGTERHESRRIDNQLRGRSGRQGDPGESRFYLCMEDDIMRLFGTERMQKMMETLKIDDDTPIDAKILSGAIENAQKKVESKNFQARKNTLEYDDVMNVQRGVIYKQRRQVLDGEIMGDFIRGMIHRWIEDSIRGHLGENKHLTAESWQLASEPYRGLFFRTDAFQFTDEELAAKSVDDLIQEVNDSALALYNAKQENLGDELMHELERVMMLRVVDEYWMDHIDAMEELKKGIQLRAYAQTNPVDAYKKEGFEMFEGMIEAIQQETIRRILVARVQTNEVRRERVAKVTGESGGSEDAASSGKKEPVRKTIKVGPNDPCPCGSGKKYKKCCYLKDKAAQ
ncbi:MAG: preprotein translocase subunit SecA [Clostridiales bacterium]|nr:preprotein translocase subunit SecA [Bacillota bacterium]MDD7085463.1 preprotein translocase subunit SecA [Clostridiales bacterium]MEE1367095.1 preprotein translocase subunit SecA [Evtepia sp.]